MKVIHKIAAMVIVDDTFLMVRKHGSTLWTTLGGRPEDGESEEQTLLREIKEEMGCDATIIKKLGDFEAPAGHDAGAIVKLSTYLVTLEGSIHFEDPELAEYRYITNDYKKDGVELTECVEHKILPYCISEGLLHWN